jgi:hyperosmotically inducible periplasmic protein
MTSDPSSNQAWLTKEVGHELNILPWLSVFDNLEYRVDGNKVTLLGQVVKPVTEDNAVNAVKSIEGVEAVDNQIQVLPLSPIDDQIREAEYRAIYSFPSLERYASLVNAPIHIIVDNGHVTLVGVIDSEADKDAANITANSVSGVFSVTNNLRVQNG